MVVSRDPGGTGEGTEVVSIIMDTMIEEETIGMIINADTVKGNCSQYYTKAYSLYNKMNLFLYRSGSDSRDSRSRSRSRSRSNSSYDHKRRHRKR